MEIKYRVRFTESFKDGTIFPVRIQQGEERVLSENEVQRVRSSGGYFDVLEKLIPNPLKQAEEPQVPAEDPEASQTLEAFMADHEDTGQKDASADSDPEPEPAPRKRKKAKKDEA